MNFLQKIQAWVKANFIWSNEDFAFITGGIVTLQQIHWDPNSSLFALAVASILKGLMSMFKITLGNTASEDIVLMIGGFVTLFEIHFAYANPLFGLTVGAIIKAAFGIFGIEIPWPLAAPATPTKATYVTQPLPQAKSPLVIEKEKLQAAIDAKTPPVPPVPRMS